ncbi:MAG: MOSC domain-containing protein, partial [Dehalococcoidia bacterium]
MEPSNGTVRAINISPVKSLGLVHPDTVHVDARGILEDRRLFLISERGRLLTQRQIGQLVQIKADYRIEPESLALSFPDGQTLEGTLELGEPVITGIFGRLVPGRVVKGDWNGALSWFCGRSVRLVMSDAPGKCYDEYPVSLISQASIEELSSRQGEGKILDSRRFRPNFLIGGCRPHEEDSWLGYTVQIGAERRLRVMARDPRCAITTHDPDTGERDVDTLRLIL